MSPVWMEAVRRLLRLLPVPLLILMCGSCDGFFVSNNDLESLALNVPGVLLKAGTSTAAGDVYTFAATGTTVGGTTGVDVTSKATWTTSNANTATVSAGTVTTVATTAAQTATITAKYTGQSATAGVLTYSNAIAPPTSLTVSSTAFTSGATLNAGTYQLHAYPNTLSTTDVASYVTWSTSNSTATSISSAGVLTVNSVTTAASVTVTATLALGAASGSSVPTPITGTIAFTAN